MKSLLTAAFVLAFFAINAQSAATSPPVEGQTSENHWVWWLIGVLLAIGAGIILYMLIKKDPKRDAVR